MPAYMFLPAKAQIAETLKFKYECYCPWLNSEQHPDRSTTTDDDNNAVETNILFFFFGQFHIREH